MTLEINGIYAVCEKEEIETALEKLRSAQARHGFLTEGIMRSLVGDRITDYLMANDFTFITSHLGARPADFRRVLSDKAIKMSFSKQQDIFNDIFGWDEVKSTLLRAVNDHRRGVCLLLYGASRTGKSLFMERLNRLNGKTVVHISADPKECSTAGLIAAIMKAYDDTGTSDFIVLIDELDKVPVKEQSRPQLLRLFDSDETRAILNVKSTKEGESKNDFVPLPYTKIIAGANEISNIYPILLNRFERIPFPEYTESSFVATGTEMGIKKFKKSRELAHFVSQDVFRHGGNMGELDMIFSWFNSIEEYREWSEKKYRNAQLVRQQQGEWVKPRS